MHTKTKRIALFGYFGEGNIGNDASLEAMVVFLRRARPKAELVCVCGRIQRVLADYHIPVILVNWPRPANFLFWSLNGLLFKVPGRLVDLFYTLKAVQQFDVMIIPGTGILDDFGDRPWIMPYALFKWCLAARITGVRVLFVSIGAGPMNHPLNRWLLKSAARLAHYRSYRDAVSKNFMESIGIDTRMDPVYPDLVFKLQIPPSLAIPREEEDPVRVGVGVMRYYGPTGRHADHGREIYETYVKKITLFVVWLLDHDYRVRLLIGDLDDQIVVDSIVNAVRAEKIGLPIEQFVSEPTQSFNDLTRQIAETDIVVASRFHNLICALKLTKPTISLGYRQRHEELMAETGLGAFCQRIEELDVDRLIDQFTTLALRRKDFARVIRDKTLVYQKRLRLQEDVLTATLL